MIKIYDINDKLLMRAEVTSAAKREQEMSKSDYISLSFSAAEKVILPVGAYINYTYKIDKVREVTRKFLLLESYEPTQSDECSWKYTPQFQHPKMILSKTSFFIYTRNSQNVEVKQYVWSFVGTTSVLRGKIVNFLNKDLMFGECGWKVIFSNITANTVNVSFSDNDFISALTAITNAIGDNCEWHIDYDDEIIYIGKVLVGAIPVVLEVGKNVGVPNISNSKESYYNAFSIFGGTRNITQVNSKGENVSSGDIRLQLDEGNGTMTIDGKECSYSIDKYSTLDLRADKTKEPLFTKVLDFSQIFPSLNTYVYNVRGRVKYVLDDNNKKIPISYNADGSVKEYKTFTVWYMRLAYPTTEKVEGKTIINTTVDEGVTHYWYDFEVTDDLLINGKNIGCSFEPNFNTGALSTPLAGRGSNGEYVGFELIYHKKASSSHMSDDVGNSNFSVLAGDYEIIYQEDNEVIIPTNKEEMLIPRGESKPSLKCNITVLYNIAMADTIYYEDAQNRLLEKAKEEIVRLLSDLNNYEVKSYSDVFLMDNPQLQIGQSVTYKDGHGYELATRVLKLSTNIDYDFIQSITVGNQAIKGTITQLKEDVQTIIASGGSSGNGGGYSVSQLRSLIAKYGSDNFISKQFNDTAHGTITFEKGLIAKGLADLMMGAKFGNSAMITKLGDAFFRTIKSIDYDNSAEQGFSVEKDKNGKYHAFFTNLTIWGKARFHELEVRKLSYSGGNIYLSGAGSKLIKVVPVKQSVSDGVTTWVETTEDDTECIGWKCYLLADDGTTATMNDWQEGDQVRCQTMGEIVAGGAYSDVSNKSYWRTIPDFGVSTQNEKIYGTKTETYLDEDGNEQTREVQVELYDGQAFAWIVIGKHCGGIDGYDDEFSVGYNGSNPAPLETRDIPSAGDTIVLDGNRHRNEHGEYDKTDRQNVIILETTGEYAPRIACYANITEYKHTITKSVNGSDKEVSLSVFETSPKGGTKINSSRFEWISDDGSTINIINYRGDWVEGTKYHKNDQVNHNNAVWVCVANSGVDVSEEPSDGSSYWKKVLSGVKGDKGDKGEDGLSGNGIVPAYVRSKDNPTPPTSTDKNNLDNGWSLTIPSVDDVKNVRYSDSSWTDYNDGSYTWKKSPITATNSTSWCLVTFTTTKANQSVMFVIKSFRETNYDYIFLSEIDESDVPSKPGYAGASRAVSGNGVELSVTDIVATAGTHTVYICYGKDTSNDYNGDYGLFRIESMAGIPLWQSNGKEVFTREDSGAIKSKIESWSEPFKVTGENGTDGKDTVSILVEDAPLVFDTADNGIVSATDTKTAKVKVMKGNTNVTNDCTSESSRDDLSSNCMSSVEKDEANECINVSIKGNWIFTDDIIVNEVSQGSISKTSGYAVAQFVYDSVVYFAQVPFSVNVAKFTGVVAFNNKQYESKFTEISTKFGQDLADAESRITQTAREISLSVSEKSIGRRNLLVGSAFNRQEGFGLNLDANVRGYGILMNDGVDGMNCIKVASYYDGTRYQYCGAFWSGNYTKNIRIKHGTKYTFSCWVKALYANTTVYLEVIYNKAEIGGDRDGRPTGTYFFSIKEPNKWQLVKWSFTTDDTHDWIEANVFTSSDVAYKTFVARFCKPMLAEGDYNGWTLSEQDYDYVGGNLLDNTLSLDKSGSLYDVNGTLTPAGFGESTSIYKSFVYKLKGTVDSFSQLPSSGNVYNDTYYVRNEETCYVYNGSEFVDVGNDYYHNVLEWRKGKPGAFTSFGLEANKDYVFSFMAKGTGVLTAYFYNPETDVFIESSLGATNISVDGGTSFQLTNKWERYWVHWRPSDSLHKYVLLRLNRSFQSNGSAPVTDCYIAQPKLEEGARVTEYTERKTDLVDKTTMKKAGIEITTNQIKLYGDKVQVLTRKDENSEYVEAGMFVNGKLNANLIDADKIEVKHLWAKSEDGTNKVGYFGNYEIDACKVNNVNAPLFVGADTAAKSPFYVTNEGHMVSTSATLGCFSLDKTSLRYISGYDDEEPGFALYNNFMLFRGYSRTFNPDTHTWKSERKRTVWLGEYQITYQVPALLSNLLIDDSFSVNGDTLKSGIRISVTGCDDSQQYNNPIYNLSNAVYGNFAIYAEHGMYGGLRPMTRKINRSMELTDMDCFVIVTKAVTLTLPAKPQRGQYYKFLQVGDNFVIKSSSNNMLWYRVSRNSFTSGALNQTTELIYDGSTWNVNWFIGK